MHTDQRPTLQQLMLLRSPSGKRVKIIQAIAAGWRHLGISLYFDETGRTLDRIAHEHPFDPEACCTAMLREWLEGRGRQPATWATLIDLLKDADMTSLAQQLERMLLPVRDEGKAGEEVGQMKKRAERERGGQRGRAQE